MGKKNKNKGPDGPPGQGQGQQQQQGPGQQQQGPRQQGPGQQQQQQGPRQQGPGQQQQIHGFQQQQGPRQPWPGQQVQGPPQQQQGPRQQGPHQQMPGFQQQQGPRQPWPGQQQQGPHQQMPGFQQQQGPGQPWPGQQLMGPPQQHQGPRQQGPPQQQQGPGQQQQQGPRQQGPPQQQQQGPRQQGPPQQQQQGPRQQGPPQQQQQGPRQQGPPQQQQQGPRQQGPPQQQQGARQQGPGQQPQRPQEAGPFPAAEGSSSKVPSSAASDAGSTKSSASSKSSGGQATSHMAMRALEPKELLAIKTKKEKDKVERKGRKIKVAVNHMALALANYNLQVYHYDVVFDPEKPKFLLRPAIRKFFNENFPGRVPIFDGNKNLFSRGPLVPNDRGMTKTVKVFNEESLKDKEMTITIAVVNKIEMKDLLTYQNSPQCNPQMALLVIDVALRSALAHSGQLVQSGRKFFTPPKGIIQLGDGVELWNGFYHSATLGWKPFLNVDISHKGFYESKSIEEAILEVTRANRGQELGDYDRKDLGAHLKGLKVEYEIPGQATSRRQFRVNDAVKPAHMESFTDDNGKRMTVEEYYKDVKKYRIQKRYLPCLWVGSRMKRVLIPAELCRIAPGQPNNKKLNERQTASMVRSATCNTRERKERIMKAFGDTGLQDTRNEYMKEFGISISGKFEEVDGRILDAPSLEYANKKTVNVMKGVWRAEQFFNAKSLDRWTILNLDSRTREDGCWKISDEFVRNGRSVGMTIQEAKNVQPMNARNRTFTTELQQFFAKCKQDGMQLVVVVIPDMGDTYARVKAMAEIKVGVLTQCIRSKTVFKLNGSTVGNLLLKVNAKLDGTNHGLSPNFRPPCLGRPVMLVGADVTHPAPGQTNLPSVAAVAASHDARAFKYNMIWRMQPKGEMIVDLENIMKEQLMYFYEKCNQNKPEKIIFYRDGVSEGEIQKVMSVEIMSIRRACSAMNVDYKPAITFVVVQKRHHTRFFPVNERDCYDTKNYNLPAGTIVDTQIVHPYETEFCLLSHASILGTARPTKYRLVYDDTNFSEEDLEKLTYYLCHLFTRCTRSVSYPAPTYNAHLAAFRARAYLEADPVNIQRLDEEQRLRKMNPELMKSSPMFYC